MNQYEVTFIVDPVLSGDEINATAQTYVDHLQSEGCKITHVDEMGLKQLAYPISKRTSGVYYCIEFSSESGDMISKLELALRRDERIMRFLVVRLDKYGVKYNDDKRKGLIGKKKTADAEPKNKDGKAKEKKAAPKTASPSPAPSAAKAASSAPVTAVAVAEEEE